MFHGKTPMFISHIFLHIYLFVTLKPSVTWLFMCFFMVFSCLLRRIPPWMAMAGVPPRSSRGDAQRGSGTAQTGGGGARGLLKGGGGHIWMDLL